MSRKQGLKGNKSSENTQGKDEAIMGRTDIKPYWGNNKQCKKCLYRAEDSKEFVYCGFMFYTGKRRPCEPSPNCTVFVKSTKAERIKVTNRIQALEGFSNGRK